METKELMTVDVYKKQTKRSDVIVTSVLQQWPLLIMCGGGAARGPWQCGIVCHGQFCFSCFCQNEQTSGRFSFQLNKLKHANLEESKHELQWVLSVFESIEWRKGFSNMLIFVAPMGMQSIILLGTKIRFLESFQVHSVSQIRSRGFSFLGWLCSGYCAGT